MLEVRDVRKSFDGFAAVAGVSLSVAAGETAAIIGPNGAGKTTFFNLITGHLRPDAGSVLLEGRDITGVAPHDVCRLGMGRSFQRTNIFPRLTVFQNVQQMLTIARTLMGNPELLLLDEPSEGLAPLVVDHLQEQIARLKREGLTILLAEQNVEFSLALADRVYVLEKGAIRFSGPAARLRDDETLRHELLAI